MADRILIAIVAFFIGAVLIHRTWKDEAKSGMFEIGGVVYKAERISP